jgi:hypothetical protein
LPSTPNFKHNTSEPPSVDGPDFSSSHGISKVYSLMYPSSQKRFMNFPRGKSHLKIIGARMVT